MDETGLPKRPPLVMFRNRAAWVRARRYTDLGAWLALVYWHTTIGTEHCVMERWVSLSDITKIDGEDYSAVPTLAE